jgi:hypothetical protein
MACIASYSDVFFFLFDRILMFFKSEKEIGGVGGGEREIKGWGK